VPIVTSFRACLLQACALCLVHSFVVSLSVLVTIPFFFEWVDFPSGHAEPKCYFPGIDLVVLAGRPKSEGVFLGAFPFSRFGSVQIIKDRLSVEVVEGDSGAVVLHTVKVEDLRVNPEYARGCFVAKVTAISVDSGRRVVPPLERPELRYLLEKPRFRSTFLR